VSIFHDGELRGCLGTAQFAAADRALVAQLAQAGRRLGSSGSLASRRRNSMASVSRSRCSHASARSSPSMKSKSAARVDRRAGDQPRTAAAASAGEHGLGPRRVPRSRVSQGRTRR
jgi:hypothetical protein